LHSGLLTFCTSVGAFMMRAVAPFILKLFGFRQLLIGNSVVVAAMVGGLALFSTATPHWLIIGYILVLGFFRATQFIALNALAYSELPPDVLSRGTGIASVAQQLSSSFGVGLGATALQIVIGPAGVLGTADFAPVFLIVTLPPLLAILGFLQLHAEDGAQVSRHRQA
jgi:hypothetical protein